MNVTYVFIRFIMPGFIVYGATAILFGHAKLLRFAALFLVPKCIKLPEAVNGGILLAIVVFAGLVAFQSYYVFVYQYLLVPLSEGLFSPRSGSMFYLRRKLKDGQTISSRELHYLWFAITNKNYPKADTENLQVFYATMHLLYFTAVVIIATAVVERVSITDSAPKFEVLLKFEALLLAGSAFLFLALFSHRELVRLEWHFFQVNLRGVDKSIDVVNRAPITAPSSSITLCSWLKSQCERMRSKYPRLDAFCARLKRWFS